MISCRAKRGHVNGIRVVRKSEKLSELWLSLRSRHTVFAALYHSSEKKYILKLMK